MSSSEQADRQVPRVAGNPSAAPSAAAAAAAAAAARAPLAPSPSSARSRTAPSQRPITDGASNAGYGTSRAEFAAAQAAAAYGAPPGSGIAATVDSTEAGITVTDPAEQATPAAAPVTAEPTGSVPAEAPAVTESGWASSPPPEPPAPQTSRPIPPPHRTAPAASGSGAARSVRLTVAGLDPWSVLKLSFLLSVAIGIALVVASVVLWSVLNGMGVFNQINRVLGDISGPENKFDIYTYVGFGRVVSLSTVLGVVNVVLITALSTLGAFLYNLGSGLVGGLHITLTDD